MDDTKLSDTPRPPAFLEGLLLVLAGGSILVGVARAAEPLIMARVFGRDAPIPWVDICVSIGTGFAGAAVLWTMAVLVRRISEITLFQRRQANLLERLTVQLQSHKTPAAPAPGLGSEGQLLQRVIAELGEVNANLLLTDQQLEIKRRQSQMREATTLAHKVLEALEADRLDEARQALTQLTDSVPDFPDVKDLQQRLEQRRQALEDRQVQELSLRTRDLMAAGEFDQALATARLLAEQYPSSEGASLAEQVRREKATFEIERRRILYTQITRYAELRQWRSALATARQFLEAHPNCTEADLIRAQMPTLTDNAQIEEVRHLRDEFRDMISRQRFMEAFEIARDLVSRFPNTAAAEELRGQMDRLATKAKTSKEEK
jgi:tetratricopeptide (TPR) repeat protein